MPGRVHVTERVARAAHHHFEFELRGRTDVKGKGPMHTYLLAGPREMACNMAGRSAHSADDLITAKRN